MENPLQKEARLKRNKEILKLYPKKTLKEIAAKYGISKEAVRQVVKVVAKQNNQSNKNNVSSIKK